MALMRSNALVARYLTGADRSQARRNEQLHLGTALEDQSAVGPEAGEVRSSTSTLARIRVIGCHRDKGSDVLVATRRSCSRQTQDIDLHR